jgi:hypothetical protein
MRRAKETRGTEQAALPEIEQFGFRQNAATNGPHVRHSNRPHSTPQEP